MRFLGFILTFLLLSCFPQQTVMVTGRIPLDIYEVTDTSGIARNGRCSVRYWNVLEEPQYVAIETTDGFLDVFLLGAGRYIGQVLRCDTAPIRVYYKPNLEDDPIMIEKEILNEGRLALFILDGTIKK